MEESATALPEIGLPAVTAATVARKWPRALGGFTIETPRDSSSTARQMVAIGPNAVLHVVDLGVSGRHAAAAVAGELRRRVAEVGRLLRAKGHRAVLRPIGSGVEDQRYAWMAAEPPEAGSTAWVPTYEALDSLAQVLRFFHDRRHVHGGVARENLWCRADGTTLIAPWSNYGFEQVALSLVDRGTFSATADVRDFGALLATDDPYLAQIAERCARDDHARPANARALLVLLRSTDAGRRYVASERCKDENPGDERRQVAEEWLDAPPFVPTSSWIELLGAVAKETCGVSIHGAKGSGKSRLLAELRATLVERNAVVAVGSCAAPGGAVVDALEHLLAQGYPVADALEQVCGSTKPEELLGRILEVSQSLARRDRPAGIAGKVVWLIDDVDDDAADARGARAFAGSRIWAAEQEALGHPSDFVVVTTTSAELGPRDAKGSDAGARIVAVHLGPLADREVKRLVCDVLGKSAETDHLAGQIAHETGGNPAHVLALVRFLVRKNLVTPLGTNWSIDWQGLGLDRYNEVKAPPIATHHTFPLPDEIARAIEEDLPSLDQQSLSVLRVLAVADRDLDLDLMAEVLATDADLLFDLVHGLAQQRVLEVDYDATPERLRFRDPVRSGKYFEDGCDAAERTRIHASLFRAFEERWQPTDVPGPMDRWPSIVPPARQREVEQQVHVLADHARGCGDHAALRKYLPASAAAAQRVSEYKRAKVVYEEAMALLSEGEPTWLWCLLGLSETRRVLGELTEAQAGFRNALSYTTEGRDPRAEIRALLGLAAIEYQRADYEVAVRLAANAFRRADQLGDEELRALSQDYVAHCSKERGKLSLAWAWASRSAAAYETLGHTEKVLRMKHLLGAVLIEESRHREAYIHQEKMKELVEGTCDRRQLAWCFMEMGHVRLETARYVDAVDYYDRAVREARAISDDRILVMALLGCAFGHMSRLDLLRAGERLGSARTLAHRAKLSEPYLQSALNWHEAWYAFLRSDSDNATDRFATSSVKLDSNRSYRLYRASSFATLGVLALGRGDLDRAKDTLDLAVSEIALAGNRYCFHLFRTYRATVDLCCESTVRDAGTHPTQAWLTEAYEFAETTSSPEVAFKAASAIAATSKSASAAHEALCRLAEAAEVPIERIRARRDLKLFVSLASLD